MNPCQDCRHWRACPYSQMQVSQSALDRAARQGRETARLLQTSGENPEKLLQQALRSEMALLLTL